MISVAIFTLDEEINLPHCLDSLVKCDDVVVVDSLSRDKTCEIARAKGCRVFQNKFTGFGDQRDWALREISFRNPWLLILDADERVTPELWTEMQRRISSCSTETAAFQLKRRFYWEGVWLKYANLYPSWIVRLVRIGKVKYINRGHAETQEVEGNVESLEMDLIDENHKGFEDWKQRQEKYAEQEAHYEISSNPRTCLKELWSPDPLVRRATMKFYARGLPFRGLFYFFYVYFFRFGWMDGWTGLRFCLAKAKMQNDIRKFVRQHRAEFKKNFAQRR